MILVYIIIDYKYQGDIYHYGVRLDLMKPMIGGSSYISIYIQLSRTKYLIHISIIRSFDPEDLRESLSEDLLLELN
jgi:hypothetical protein